jgi:hypothetical protein
LKSAGTYPRKEKGLLGFTRVRVEVFGFGVYYLGLGAWKLGYRVEG